MNKIYLDNASTTPMSSEVLNEMMPYFTTIFGNPSSLHSYGRETKSALDLARERIAKGIGCNPDEVYFTSGATESNNWAVSGIMKANRHRGNHMITTKMEHPSILESCKKLEREGYRVTYLDVDAQGLVRIDQLLHYIQADTVLISIMSANNEVGTIQNLQAISSIAKEKGVIFHTDATQAIGALNYNVHEMGIDALTLNGHKINGPKGIGALYIHKGIAITSFMMGGDQESGLRSGTSNVPAIVGLGKAVENATRDVVVNSKKMRILRDYFINKVTKEIELVTLNGHPVQRLPNNINLSFGIIDGETIMAMLDLENIAVSTGSACSSGSTASSHVLSAMGLSDEMAKSAVRFSLSKSTTQEELDYVIDKLIEIVKKLRSISALSKNQVNREVSEQCTTKK